MTVGWIITIGATAGALIAVATLAGMIWRGGVKVFRTLIGQVRGVVREETCPIREDVAEVKGRVSDIEAEMHPNAGGSLRDAVDRVERTVTED